MVKRKGQPAEDYQRVNLVGTALHECQGVQGSVVPVVFERRGISGPLVRGRYDHRARARDADMRKIDDAQQPSDVAAAEQREKRFDYLPRLVFTARVSRMRRLHHRRQITRPTSLAEPRNS